MFVHYGRELQQGNEKNTRANPISPNILPNIKVKNYGFIHVKFQTETVSKNSGTSGGAPLLFSADSLLTSPVPSISH
jgi:hypothetical protein